MPSSNVSLVTQSKRIPEYIIRAAAILYFHFYYDAKNRIFLNGVRVLPYKISGP